MASPRGFANSRRLSCGSDLSISGKVNRVLVGRSRTFVFQMQLKSRTNTDEVNQLTEV